MPTARCPASVFVQGANEEAGAEDADDLAACANFQRPPAGERVSLATLDRVTIGDNVAVYWRTEQPGSGTKGEWLTGTVKKIWAQSEKLAVQYPKVRSWDEVDIGSEYVVRTREVCRRLP